MLLDQVVLLEAEGLPVSDPVHAKEAVLEPSGERENELERVRVPEMLAVALSVTVELELQVREGAQERVSLKVSDDEADAVTVPGALRLTDPLLVTDLDRLTLGDQVCVLLWLGVLVEEGFAAPLRLRLRLAEGLLERLSLLLLDFVLVLLHVAVKVPEVVPL